jgi:hypothetical protein
VDGKTSPIFPKDANCLKFHSQLFLDENGNVDKDTTIKEAKRFNAAKMKAAESYGQKKALRKRRSQAQNIELMEMQMMLAEQAPESSEFEGWVFRTSIDCKIGVLLESARQIVYLMPAHSFHLIQNEHSHLQGLASYP